jgi:ferrous iron transport protein B
LGKAIERLWLYLKKITTIVAAVAAALFVLLRFPGLSAERIAYYEDKKDALITNFHSITANTPYAIPGGDKEIMPLMLYWDAYRKARMAAGGESGAAAVNRGFRLKNPQFYRIVQPGGDSAAVKVNRALRSLARGRESLLVDMRRERLENSLLGRLGKGLEPFTVWSGFDWRINVALLSALAAKESSVATLGAIYEQNESNGSLEERMAAEEAALTPLHALALMLFMVLYPPCIATAIAVKVQTGSLRWMLFSMGYPIFLGLTLAMVAFSGGKALGLSGIQAMYVFYALALAFAVLTGFMKPRPKRFESLPHSEGLFRFNRVGD